MPKPSKSSNYPITLIIALFMAMVLAAPAQSVENGKDASGNGFVVPILIKYNATQWKTCSGALISPFVVATAGHCLLDESGGTSTIVNVGPPGASSEYNAATWTNSFQSYMSVDYKGSTIAGNVTSSDIAFFVLARSFDLPGKIYFASETQLLDLKSSAAKLRVFGYGYTSDAGATTSSPNYFDATFGRTNSLDPNASWGISTASDACQGDSGGPVLNITPTKTILVGIVTSAHLSKNCSQKENDGTYLVGFTVISRFSNLAMAAQEMALETLIGVNTQNVALATSKEEELVSVQVELTQARMDLDQAVADSETVAQQVVDLNSQITAYKATGLKLLSCKVGTKTKLVATMKTKCP
jgi:secreted trypsin-like serine protease